MKKGIKPHKVGKVFGTNKNIGTTYNNFKRVERESDMKYPKQLLEFKEPHPAVYSAQKPVELIEYLLQTYTKEGDTILDFCMGSGTTGVACKNLNRNFIGIDKSLEAFNIAKNRLEVI